MLKTALQLLLTEEHVARESRDARAQWDVVLVEVEAVWIGVAVVDVPAAAVHGVDGTVVELVALQLAGFVVRDLVARQ